MIPPKQRIASWNILRYVGANTKHIIKFIEDNDIDILCLQEVTPKIFKELQAYRGTTVIAPFKDRQEGVAIWSRKTFTSYTSIALPHHHGGPYRTALIASSKDLTCCSVHLEHHPIGNRSQLSLIAKRLEQDCRETPEKTMVITGDTNMLGPHFIRGWRDSGTREKTFYLKPYIPLRLDRFYVKNAYTYNAKCYDSQHSDHCPVSLDIWNEQQFKTLSQDGFEKF